MSNERIYNIALDRYMEEKIKLMQQFKKFPKTLYYNQKDKDHLLYNLDPTLAKQIWERLKYNIYCKGASWFSQSTCPFCIESEIRFIERNKNRCENCTYKKNHRNIICMSPNSDLSKICDSRIFTINNSQYSNIIKEISKELFEPNDIKNNDKFEKSKSITNYNNFTIVMIKNSKKNHFKKIICDSLYSIYDFTTGEYYGKCIVTAETISCIANKNFENIDPKTIKIVFEFVENYGTKFRNSTIDYNFEIYSTGEIKLGYNMQNIKENLEEIKKKYEEYLESKDKYNVIKFEIKD